MAGTPLGRDRLETDRRARWTDFYRSPHQRPVAATYREVFAADVDVRDTVGHWVGRRDWAAHEREALRIHYPS